MIKIIYHSADMDGLTSGKISYNALKEKFPNSEINLFPIDYHESDKMGDITSDIKKNDIVVMADVSFPIKYMQIIYEKLNKNFIFIDHHRSSMDAIEAAGLQLNGLTRVGTAACLLCWEFFYSDAPPKAVTLLGRYDIFDLDDDVTNFQLGIKTYDLELASSTWQSIIKSNDIFMKDVMERGSVINKYLCSFLYNYIVDNFAIETTIDGNTALILNNAEKGSNALVYSQRARENKYDIFCTYRQTYNKNWSVGLYGGNSGKDVDCSEIAKKIGGGGHKKAAGCEVKDFNELSKFLGLDES